MAFYNNALPGWEGGSVGGTRKLFFWNKHNMLSRISAEMSEGERKRARAAQATLRCTPRRFLRLSWLSVAMLQNTPCNPNYYRSMAPEKLLYRHCAKV